jgi:hypothetical protein
MIHTLLCQINGKITPFFFIHTTPWKNIQPGTTEAAAVKQSNSDRLDGQVAVVQAMIALQQKKIMSSGLMIVIETRWGRM